ncbi:MAG: aspartate kinase [Candidatus Gastranaerophilaceae bacterium]|nr:aspartate kinase [Christensenellales bacterium]
MLIVMKFGGSSLSTADRIDNAARIIAKRREEGDDVVAVVSAQGGVTDKLVRKGLETAESPSLRENDVLLSSGELVSMSLMAMKLCSIGVDAVSLSGWQAGIHTSGQHGGASISYIDTKRILAELEAKRAVIVAGFQGINDAGDITTLGRGGSDTTAIALAAALHADSCYIYSDVRGVFSADPKTVDHAVKHEEISYDEMLEMSSLGAKILHNRSVGMAKQSGVQFEVLSSFDGQRGTLIHDFSRENCVSGIVCDDNVAMISALGIDSGGATSKLFSFLAENNIHVDTIIRSPRSDGLRGVVSFSVPGSSLKDVISAINGKKGAVEFERLAVEDNLAKISVVGTGMADGCGVAARMLVALSRIGIEPKYITTGEIRVSVIIKKALAEVAANAVHDEFFN